MADTIATQQRKPIQLSPLISQLFTSCINNDITTMKELINNQHVNPYSHYYINLDHQYNIPTKSFLSHKYTITLLDASILSNSPSMIDYVIELLYNNTTNKPLQNEITNDVELFSLSQKIGFDPFALGLLTNNFTSVYHLAQHYNINTDDYPKQYHNCIRSMLIQRNLNSKEFTIVLDQDQIHITHIQQQSILESFNPTSTVENNSHELIEPKLQSIDIDIPNDDQGTRTLYYFVRRQRKKMAQLLMEHNADPSFQLICRNACSNILSRILHHTISNENVTETFIDFLLSQPKIDIELRNDQGYKPILTAAQCGNLRILKHLINHYNPKVHVKTTDGKNLFHCAILSGDKCTIELLQYIHSLGVKINQIDQGLNELYRKSSPLTYAIYNGLSFEVIKQLVKLGADIITTNDDIYNENGESFSNPNCQSHLFQATLLNDNYKVFHYLATKCPSPTNHLITLFKDAFHDHNFDLVKTIASLDSDQFDPVSTDVDVFSIIFDDCASVDNISSTQIEIIQHLLNEDFNCFDFNKKHNKFNKSTPLLILSTHPSSTMRFLRLLIDHNADIYSTDENGHGILHKLCNVQNQAISSDDLISKIDFFISRGVDINQDVYTDIDINQDVDADIGDDEIATPLHFAIANPIFQTTLVPHLITQHHANISCNDNQGRIPLHYVIHPQLISLLSSSKIINRQDHQGFTPLSFSLRYPSEFPSSNDYYQCILNLIEHHANIIIPMTNGEYPIHILFRQDTFQHQPIEVIQLLMKQNDIDVHCINSHGETSLHMTIQRFVNPIDIDYEGDDVVEIKLKAIESIKLLLQHHADINVRPHFTILHYINQGFHSNEEIDEEIDEEINEELIEEFMDVIMNGIIDQLDFIQYE